jgi:hypothetical protein
MKFEVRKTDYNEYDVRLNDKTATRIRRFLWFLYYAAIGLLVNVILRRWKRNDSPDE